MKNAAMIRIIVSAGPVSVFVIAGVIGVVGLVVGAVVTAVTGAESVYATHSL